MNYSDVKEMPAEALNRKPGELEFHSNRPLSDDFYKLVQNLHDAQQIVDVWLIRMASFLREHEYEMTITKFKR